MKRKKYKGQDKRGGDPSPQKKAQKERPVAPKASPKTKRVTTRPCNRASNNTSYSDPKQNSTTTLTRASSSHNIQPNIAGHEKPKTRTANSGCRVSTVTKTKRYTAPASTSQQVEPRHSLGEARAQSTLVIVQQRMSRARTGGGSNAARGSDTSSQTMSPRSQRRRGVAAAAMEVGSGSERSK